MAWASIVATMSATAFAQGMAQQVFPEEGQGKFSNYPVGLGMYDPTQSEKSLIRAPSVVGGVPVPWSSAIFGAATTNHPDYSLTALTAHWWSGSSVPEFGGISTGGEVMPAVNTDGRMIMTTGNWYMLSITVGRNAKGEDYSLLKSRTVVPGSSPAVARNPAGDILSYYAKGSTGINDDLEDTVRLEYSREQLQLQDPLPTATGPRELTNHDFGVGVISVDPGNRSETIFPVRNAFYFTLSLAWVTGPGSALQLDSEYVNASTIYGMIWNGTTWDDPFIAFTHAELFPGYDLHEVEIDALSVDKGSGTVGSPDRAVFSLTPDSDDVTDGTFDQILVFQRDGSAGGLCDTTALLIADSTTPGTRVSERFGLKPRTSFVPGLGEPDNVRSTCGGDPKEPYEVGPVCGIATGANPTGDGDMGLSVVRTCVPVYFPENDEELPPAGPPAMVETLNFEVTGFDFDGFDLGFIRLYIEGANGPEQLGAAYWIDPASEALNALDIAIPMENYVIGLPVKLRARCVGFNFSDPNNPVELLESWVITIEV